RGAATGAVGRGQVQLAGEARGAVIVLGAGDHGMRATVLGLAGGAVVSRRDGRLGMAMAMRLARRGVVGDDGSGGLGLGAHALGLLGLAALGGFRLLDAAAVGLGQAVLLFL